MDNSSRMEIDAIHHVSLPVRDLARSRAFYRDVLGLDEIARPPFDFAGAWFRLGAGQLHLIVHDRATFRAAPRVDSRDIHFAVRVRSFRDAVAWLEARGFRGDAEAGDPRWMRVRPSATAGFPQIHIVDPDGHVIELNAERADDA